MKPLSASDIDTLFDAAERDGIILDACPKCDDLVYCREIGAHERRAEGNGYRTPYACHICGHTWATWYSSRWYAGPNVVQPLRPRREEGAASVRPPRSISAGQRARIMERDGFCCRRCNHGREHRALLVVDHIVPVSRGGTAVDSNLQTLCRECNAGKAARAPHPHDFIE